MRVRNRGPWPVAYFDEEHGRVDLPVGEAVDVPSSVGRRLARLEHVAEARGD